MLNYNPPITTPPRFTLPTPNSYPTASSTMSPLPSSSNQNLEDKIILQGRTIDTELTPIRSIFRSTWLNNCTVCTQLLPTLYQF